MTAELPILTLLLATKHNCIRHNGLTLEATCYRHSRSNPSERPINKRSLSNRHREASRLRRMVLGHCITNTNSRWRRPLHLVWHGHRIIAWWLIFFRNLARQPSQLASDFGKVKESHNLLLSRLRAHLNDLIRKSSLSVLKNHVLPRLRAPVGPCKRCLSLKSQSSLTKRKAGRNPTDKHARAVWRLR